MYETLCFLLQSSSPNLDDLFLRCDGCETVSCVVGSVPHYAWGFNCFSCMRGRQNSIVFF